MPNVDARRAEYEARLAILVAEQPTDWDLSSFPAFQMFKANRAEAIESLRTEYPELYPNGYRRAGRAAKRALDWLAFRALVYLTIVLAAVATWAAAMVYHVATQVPR